MKVYECQNTSSCSLGTRDAKGRFSSGLTPKGAAVLGLPPDAPTGDGICPNCGEPGKALGNEPDPTKGEDPNQELHDKIGAETASKLKRLDERVLDPDDEMTEEKAADELNVIGAEAHATFHRRLVAAEKAGDK